MSDTCVHACMPGNPWHRHPVPGKVWHGQDRGLRACMPPADGRVREGGLSTRRDQ